MEPTLPTIIWQQFGAAVDMLEKALRACPDELWKDSLWNDSSMSPEFSAFWYIGYHTLFWVDLYLTGSVEGFSPPAPFNLDELDPAGLLPDRPYTREELLAYLDHDRKKLWATTTALTDEKAARLCHFPWGEVSFLELLLDNMRHVQEHGAQLNMYLGQKAGSNSRWVGKSKTESGG
jgi:hypothetical protein